MFGGARKHLPDSYENGIYRRVLQVDGKSVLVSISSLGTTLKPRLRVEVHPHLSKSKSLLLRAVLNRMVEASFDYVGFLRVARKDRIMRDVCSDLAGIRPVRPPTIFEILIIAITEQQISFDAAITIRSRLVERCGERMAVDGTAFYAFPTPEVLAHTTLSKLRRVGLSRAKAQYIKELSKRIVSKELELEGLRKLTDEAAMAELMRIKGVGRWSAEYALLRGLGRVNSLPADDLGVQRAVSISYFHGRKVSSDKVRRVLRKFAPYSGIAAFYLMYNLFWRAI
jgi:DNA-3-methyladenine glycosylase II